MTTPFNKLDARLSGRAWPYIALILVGAGWRIVWLWHRGLEPYALGEANNVAHAVARTGQIAEALGPGTGPTAHLSPITPGFAGLIYRMFGLESNLSLALLSIFAVSLLVASAVLIDQTLKEMDARCVHRILVFAALMLSPISPSLEVISFRCWEGGLAVLLASISLLLIVKTECHGALSYRRSAGLGLAFAVLLFVSPPLGVSAYLAGLILLVRTVPSRTLPFHFINAAIILALVLFPWTYRNYQNFNRFVPLRSNFGLELAIAMHPAAVGAVDPAETFTRRMNEIHPLRQPNNREFLQRMGGEVDYAKALQKKTVKWMSKYPSEAVGLSAIYAIEYYFPPQWFWVDSSKLVTAKQAIIWILSGLGLLGSLVSFVVWRGNWTYVALFATVTSLPYWIVQPVLRYSYLVYPFLVVLALKILLSLTVKVASAYAVHRESHANAAESNRL